MNSNDPYRISAVNAAQIRDWILTRGGVNVWNSLNLADPAKETMTPVHDASGTPTGKPHWSCGKVIRVLTRLDEVEVVTGTLVKRFHIAVRVGGQGLSLKVSDGGSRRIRAEVAKAGDGAWHEFDYETQDALIFKPGPPVPLSAWNVTTTEPSPKQE